MMTGAIIKTRWHPRRSSRAFTLLELLITVAIIALLVTILFVSVRGVRSAARNVGCKNNLKMVAFEFAQFADESSHPYRGDSEKSGIKGFYIEDFQERLYGISEFWRSGTRADPLDPAGQPLMCPAGSKKLIRRPGLPCSGYAVTPVENVSIGFNKRLDRAAVSLGGFSVLKPVRLTESILDHPSIPLAFDLDGEAAGARRMPPYYAAPPVAGESGAYANGRFWFASSRHQGEVNACFVGGHVLSSRTPEHASGWTWRYQAPPE